MILKKWFLKLVTLVILSQLYMISYSQESGEGILHLVNRNNDNFWNNYFSVTSATGQSLSYALPTSLLAIGLIAKDGSLTGKSLVVASGMLVSVVLTTGLKYTINAERHYKSCPLIVKKDVGGSPSFPSGHTSDAFALATGLSLQFPKWYVIVPSYLWAGSVGYGRMYQGVHCFHDVGVGALIGIGSAFLSYKLNSWMRGK
jgi:membrane-associated phospholipid phosphatase